jgi:hypothetical protein
MFLVDNLPCLDIIIEMIFAWNFVFFIGLITFVHFVSRDLNLRILDNLTLHDHLGIINVICEAFSKFLLCRLAFVEKRLSFLSLFLFLLILVDDALSQKTASRVRKLTGEFYEV